MAWTGIMSKLRSFIGGMRRKKGREQAPFPDRETLQEYLGQLAQELNLRLLCREEVKFTSEKVLWVQEITVTEYRDNPQKKAGHKKHKAVRRKER